MAADNFTLTLLTEQSPEVVFQAINKVRNWWSGYYSEVINGETEKLNDEFDFSAGEGVHYSKQKLVEVIPDKKVVWLITDSEFGYIENKDEWTGTKVIFEISEKDGKTQLLFTHMGLTPEAECYEACGPAWTLYLQNRLLPLINANHPLINAFE